METTFPIDSRSGRLWEDVKKHAIAKGISAEKLEQWVDRDYVEDPFYVPARIHDPKKISAGEVLEFAYRFWEYYPYLHKHGFPVPFVMDDFDPATEADKKFREEIAGAIRKFKQETEDVYSKVDSDDYRLALAGKIFEWVRQIVKEWDGNRLREHPLWVAYQKKEGECTEKSSLLFYAYQKAGLAPSFFQISSLPPTLKNHALKDEDSMRDGHVFVGIPLRGAKKWFYVDASLGLFDAPYSKPVMLTPRQFVYGGFLHNQYGDAWSAHDIHESKKAFEECLAVAPLSYLCFEMGYNVYLFGRGLEGAVHYLNEQKPLLQFYPDIKEWPHLALEFSRGGNQKDFVRGMDNRMRFIEKLSSRHPYFAALKSFGIYKDCVEMINKLKSLDEEDDAVYRLLIDYAKQNLIRAVTYNPYWLHPFSELRELVKLETACIPEVFNLLHEIGRKYPDHALAHYFAVQFGVELPKEDVAKLELHIQKLKELEPDHPGATQILLFHLLSAQKLEEAVHYFEERKEHHSGLTAWDVVLGIAFAYRELGQGEEGLKVFRKICNAWPLEGKSTLIEGLKKYTDPQNLLEGAKRGENRPESRNREIMAFEKKLIDFVSKMPEARETVPALWANFLLSAILLGETEGVQSVKEKLGENLAGREVRESFMASLDGFFSRLENMDEKLSAERIKKLEKLFLRFRTVLSEAKIFMALGLVEAARLYLAINKQREAKEVFRRAYEMDNGILSEEIYANRVVRPLFSLCTEKSSSRGLLVSCLGSLELAIPYRERLSEPVLQIIKTGYQILAEKRKRVPPRERALIQKRLKAFP